MDPSRLRPLVPALLVLVGLLGCGGSPPRAALAVATAPATPAESGAPDAGANQVAAGFAVEVAVRGLNEPTSVETDGDGALCISETVPGADGGPSGRILRIARDGSTSVVADGFAGGIADLLWHDGRLFVSHPGAVSVVEDGAVREVVRALPSQGDHGNTQLAAGPDGFLYLGQGSATDAGVVGPDNAWVGSNPAVRDVPARAIRLRDQVFTVSDPGWQGVKTRAFHPAGSAGSGSVPGNARANGAILRFTADGGGLEAYAWGLRNPAGLQWTADGRLYASDQGFACRGSRPIAGAPDTICDIRRDGWYGWPDFAGGEPVTAPEFRPPGGPRPGFLLAEHPPLIQPLLRLSPRRGIAKLAAIPAGLCPDGSLLVARSGQTGTDAAVAGDVLVVDPRDGGSRLFLRARGDPSRPAGRGLLRPVDVAWDGREQVIHVVDRGDARGDGVVWRIARLGARGTFPPDIRLGDGPIPTARLPAATRGSAGGIEPLAPSQRPLDESDRLPQEPVPAHPVGAALPRE